MQFNEWPKRRHTPHKLLLVIPYFTATIAYRASAIALLGAFVGEFAAVPLVLIALAQGCRLYCQETNTSRFLKMVGFEAGYVFSAFMIIVRWIQRH